MIKSRHSKIGWVIKVENFKADMHFRHKVEKNHEGPLRFLSTLMSNLNFDLVTPTKFLSTLIPSLGFDLNTPCSKCLSAFKFSISMTDPLKNVYTPLIWFFLSCDYLHAESNVTKCR